VARNLNDIACNKNLKKSSSAAKVSGTKNWPDT
jgi:hypothetical protein